MQGFASTPAPCPFIIEDGVPIPSNIEVGRRTNKKYRFHAMSVGQSFFANVKLSALRVAISKAHKDLRVDGGEGPTFAYAESAHGYRVWRIL